MTEPLHVAILGAGRFGREAHLGNLLQMDDVRVVAASSRSEGSLAQATQLAGAGLQTFTDWRAALDVDGLDAVVISLINSQHCEASVAALEAGKHVFCEKPMALTTADCDRMVAAAAAAGKVLQVGHELRHTRLYQHMKRMVDAGELGDIRLMWTREFRAPMRLGWRASEQLTGGALLEKCVHFFDLFNWFFGGAPTTITGLGGREVVPDREILDNAFVVLEYPGGRRATLELCLFAPHGADVEIGVVGTDGRLDSFNQAMRLVHHRFSVPDRMEMTVGDVPGESGFVDAAGHVSRGVYAELREFVACCRSGGQPAVDGQVGRLGVAVSLAAQEAIRRREVVHLDAAANLVAANA